MTNLIEDVCKFLHQQLSHTYIREILGKLEFQS